MNDSTQETVANASPAEIMSARFANMVIQQTNMALMFLGQVPHPETGEHIQDLQTARMFIDQLEMLEVKTKGNLDKREEGLLKQSLTALHMAFVEAMNQQPSGPTASQEASGPTAGSPPPNEPAHEAESDAIPGTEGESRKKFTKKY